MSIKTIHIPAGGGFDNVTVETAQPVDPGPGEITVRLRASSLNFHDYMVAAFRHQESGALFGKIVLDI